jgi:hypothetical protein
MMPKVQHNHYMLMELYHKKDMKNQVKFHGYMQMICAKTAKCLNSSQMVLQQMIVDKES